MTREKTIEILKELWKYEKVDYTDNEVREALDMAIEALKAEPCEDCVSRERVKYLIHTLRIPKEYEQPLWDGLNDLPPVTPKQRTGKWIKQKIGYGCSNCTLCTNDYGVGIYRFCPNCGAKMEGVSE